MQGRRPTALYRGGLGESVPTHVQCGFPGRAHTTAGRAAPSDSAVLWLPNACTTCVHIATLKPCHQYDGTALTPRGLGIEFPLEGRPPVGPALPVVPELVRALEEFRYGLEVPAPQQLLLESRKKRSIQLLPSGSRTNAGEGSIPRKSSSFWKSSLMNCEA